MTIASEHWRDIAARWEQVGPPLRPGAEDLAFVEPLARQAPRALILGVTPELYQLPWKDETKVFAADHTEAMIRAVWPGPGGSVIRADWRALPLAKGRFDLLLCDGGVHLQSWPDGQRALVASAANVLRPGGKFAVRFFNLPSDPESPETVLAEFESGVIPTLNHLKIRLGMAIQKSSAEGVRVRHVWDALQAEAMQKAAKRQWPSAHFAALDSYRESPNRYCFTELQDSLRLFEGLFQLESLHHPTYELGERFPTVVFLRTADPVKAS